MVFTFRGVHELGYCRVHKGFSLRLHEPLALQDFSSLLDEYCEVQRIAGKELLTLLDVAGTFSWTPLVTPLILHF